MARGGRRKRWISRGDVSVWCPAGRWGPRRTRVTECWAVLRAEDLYTDMLRRDAVAVRPGARGHVTYTLTGGRDVKARWEIRENSIWRRGRVFFECPRCNHRCTRLYLPLADSWLACRACWGLTYQSRTLVNYKDSSWGRSAFAQFFGTTQRDWAYEQTDENRRHRRRESRKRWTLRREYFNQMKPGGDPQ
jgi:hypothetical protein